MKNILRQKFLVTSVVLTILVLVSLVNASIKLSGSRKDFRNEMAQRLDLEEKMSKMEKERHALISKIQVLSADAVKSKDKILSLEENLAEERKEKEILGKALEELEAKLKDAMQQ